MVYAKTVVHHWRLCAGALGACSSNTRPPRAGGRRLFHALSIARQAEAELTVVVVATRERVDVGCARCRHNAALWNREMRWLAEDALAEAADLVGPSRTVEYAMAYGEPKQALAGAAARSGADVKVVPWQPNGRLRRLYSSSIAEHLRRDGRWEVVVVPAATAQNSTTAFTAHPLPPDRVA
jgi:nucleotide-binding universal stress UspA family protein